MTRLGGDVRLRVGVLAVQGAVSEHTEALRRAADEAGRDVEVIAVRTPADLEGVHGLVLPGGESTTISRLLRSSGLQDVVRERGGRDLALFGTCAGMILLCDRAEHDVAEKDVELLGFLNALVDRNAFGRQRESFEAVLEVAGVGAMPAVFIRAPAVLEQEGAQVLARFRDRIVALRRGTVLATAFHPELTPDARLHGLFLRLVEEASGTAGAASSAQASGASSVT